MQIISEYSQFMRNIMHEKPDLQTYIYKKILHFLRKRGIFSLATIR